VQGLKGLQGPEGLQRLMPPGAPGANIWKWEGTGPDGQGMVFAFGGGRRIGVSTTQLTKQLADYFGIADGKGVLVTSVADDSPAAKAGIKAGDVITAIDGEKVEGAGDLSRAINKKKDGEVTLIVIHNKTQRTVTVTPTEAKPPDQPGVPQGRRIVVPRIEVGSIPEMNIVIPQINFPVIPEINIQLPKKIRTPRVRVIKSPAQQPI
jgi:membrane-associated protease RseP (regulator of RpoE activity)